MGFHPCNRALKIQEFIWDSNSQQWEFTWECEGLIPHSFELLGARDVTFVSFLARNLANRCLRCEPKARVPT